MRLRVLGGTQHGGRAVAEVALARGDEVTTINRGQTGTDVPGARVRRADRTDQAQLRSALGDDSWDAVIDTWSRAPRVVSESAALLSGRAGHHGYVSSRAVYTWPIPAGGDESAPVFDGDAASEQCDDYPAAKRMFGLEPAVSGARGTRRWTELRVGAPPEGEAAARHEDNFEASTAAALFCGPVEEPGAATGRWLRPGGDPPVREGGLKHG